MQGRIRPGGFTTYTKFLIIDKSMQLEPRAGGMLISNEFMLMTMTGDVSYVKKDLEPLPRGVCV